MGGAGMVITENVAIGRSARQLPRQPILSDERDIDAYRSISSEIHRHGALAIMQIVHAGRYAGPWEQYHLERRLAPSAVEFELRVGEFVTPAEMSTDEIAETITRFGASARLAEAAGFDGVELHAAQGLMISTFLSSLTNYRSDMWGGSLRNRLRFLLSVCEEVRSAVSHSFVVGVHLLCDELNVGGWTLQDALQSVSMLNQADIDFVIPAIGTFETIRSTANEARLERPNYARHEAAELRRASSFAIFANGAIRNPHTMEEVLRNGEADAIALARPIFADPDWVHKLAGGRFEDIRSCACADDTCLRTQRTGSVCDVWPDSAARRGYFGYRDTYQ